MKCWCGLLSCVPNITGLCRLPLLRVPSSALFCCCELCGDSLRTPRSGRIPVIPVSQSSLLVMMKFSHLIREELCLLSDTPGLLYALFSSILATTGPKQAGHPSRLPPHSGFVRNALERLPRLLLPFRISLRSASQTPPLPLLSSLLPL